MQYHTLALTDRLCLCLHMCACVSKIVFASREGVIIAEAVTFTDIQARTMHYYGPSLLQFSWIKGERSLAGLESMERTTCGTLVWEWKSISSSRFTKKKKEVKSSVSSGCKASLSSEEPSPNPRSAPCSPMRVTLSSAWFFAKHPYHYQPCT